MPLQFIENQGQADSRVSYYAQDRNTTVYFTPEGITISLTATDGPQSGLRNSLTSALGFPASRSKTSRHARAKQRWALKLDFIGSRRDVKPKGADPTASVVSYFSGSESKSNAQTYKGLIYENLWPGIDLLYAGASNRLKYTFVVRPGADVNQIKLACRGATSARVTSEGRLEVDTPLGSITDDKPYSYQDADGQRASVPVQYKLEREADNYVYGFSAGSYDKSRTLVIDPVVLVYCGYVGGAKDDKGFDIAIDNNHNAYITGSTDSGAKSFPVTAGPDLEFNGGDSDAFVAKINSEGSELIYCSYIGGSKFDAGVSIAVDGVGNAYISGDTNSKASSFPVTAGPGLNFNGGKSDTFVAKINTSGTALVYCGYIGGEGCEFNGGIAVDKAGNAYVFGQTSSDESTFPVKDGPDVTFNSPGTTCDENSADDCFVAKVNTAGTALIYCGYIGGLGTDEAFIGDIAVDDTGSAYVAGRTNSDESTFPVVVGPDLTHNGKDDVFVAKVNASGAGLDYCGYIGGAGVDGENGSLLAIGRSGNAYVFGDTLSSQSSFPLAVGPDLIKDGNQAAFVARVNASGTGLDYCGYIESKDGINQTFPGGIAVDGSGNAYIFGDTLAGPDTFPVLLGPDLTFNGDFDTFVAKINAAGTGLIYCGYIGGGNEDEAFDGGIAVDESGNAYVVGNTASKEGSFPVAVGPGFEFNDGDIDAFVAKIATEEGFSLKHEKRVISIGRGKDTELDINIDRDEGFADAITITPRNPDEKGVKVTPGERISRDAADNKIKFTLKVKSGASRGVRRLFFTGRTLSGIEHTSAVIIDVTKR